MAILDCYLIYMPNASSIRGFFSFSAEHKLVFVVIFEFDVHLSYYINEDKVRILILLGKVLVESQKQPNRINLIIYSYFVVIISHLFIAFTPHKVFHIFINNNIICTIFIDHFSNRDSPIYIKEVN